MTLLTEEQKRIYLASRGEVCPSCGSTDFDSTGDESAEGEEYWRGMECKVCHKAWTDVFHLVDVIDDEEIIGVETPPINPEVYILVTQDSITGDLENQGMFLSYTGAMEAGKKTKLPTFDIEQWVLHQGEEMWLASFTSVTYLNNEYSVVHQEVNPYLSRGG